MACCARAAGEWWNTFDSCSGSGVCGRNGGGVCSVSCAGLWTAIVDYVVAAGDLLVMEFDTRYSSGVYRVVVSLLMFVWLQ